VAIFVFNNITNFMMKQVVREFVLVLRNHKFITLWTKAHCGTVP